MNRMEEVDLQAACSKASTQDLRERVSAFPGQTPDPVKLHLGLNAHACGFYSGARYAEQYGYKDIRRWWQRLAFWSKRPTLLNVSNVMSQQYLARFPSLSVEDSANVSASASEGFRKGFVFRMNDQRTA